MARKEGDIQFYLEKMVDITWGYDPSGEQRVPVMPRGIKKWYGHYKVDVKWNYTQVDLFIDKYGVRFKESCCVPVMTGMKAKCVFYFFGQTSEWTKKIGLKNTLTLIFNSNNPESGFQGSFQRQGEGLIALENSKFIGPIKDDLVKYKSGKPNFSINNLTTFKDGKSTLGGYNGWQWALSLGFASRRTHDWLRENENIKMSNGVPLRFNTWWDANRIGYVDRSHALVTGNICAPSDWMYLYKDTIFHAVKSGGGMLILLSKEYFKKPFLTCVGKHFLTKMATPRPGWGCDHCQKSNLPMGTILTGCRICNWDFCEDCGDKNSNNNLNCLREIMFAQRMEIEVPIKFILMDEPGKEFFYLNIAGNLKKPDKSKQLISQLDVLLDLTSGVKESQGLARMTSHVEEKSYNGLYGTYAINVKWNFKGAELLIGPGFVIWRGQKAPCSFKNNTIDATIHIAGQRSEWTKKVGLNETFHLKLSATSSGVVASGTFQRQGEGQIEATGKKIKHFANDDYDEKKVE